MAKSKSRKPRVTREDDAQNDAIIEGMIKDDEHDKDIKDVKDYVSSVAETMYDAAQEGAKEDAKHDAEIKRLDARIDLAKSVSIAALKEAESAKEEGQSTTEELAMISQKMTKANKGQRIFDIIICIFLIAEAILLAL